jgi:hypothetical protein
MNEPLPNTRLAVETAYGTIHYAITYLDQLSRGIAVVTVISAGGDWIDLGSYNATLIDGDTRTTGSFTVVNCQTNGGQILFMGIWRAQ